MAKKRIRTIETDIFGNSVLEAPINSKQKGMRNERVASKFMEKWTGVKWTRTPSSGGLRWQDTANVCGDLVCEVQDFFVPIALETKHYKNLTFAKKLRSNSFIYTIYDQAKRDADRGKKRAFLLLRKNGMSAGEFMIYTDFELPLDLVSTGTRDETTLFGYTSQQVLDKLTWNKFCSLIKL
jgi:hypothetical protein